jgi:opacity protein-like surface antigen
MTKLPVLVCLGALGALAQPFSIGIKAGVPFTDFVSAVQNPSSVSVSTISNRYIVGPMAELRLPFGLGVELDALYRHYSFRAPTESASTNDFEFPLVAKYHFKAPIVKPYIEGGVAWDRIQGLSETFTSITHGGSSPSSLHKSTVTGFVMGAGLSIHVLVIHISPELRYTRWGARHFLDPNGSLNSNQNQAEFLVGFTF